jgi:hypothetical protein
MSEFSNLDVQELQAAIADTLTALERARKAMKAAASPGASEAIRQLARSASVQSLGLEEELRKLEEELTRKRSL